MDLFEFQEQETGQRHVPLADRMRPRTLEEFLGQEQIVGPGCVLRRMIERDQLSSMIFYGPPGCGKTTLARLISSHSEAEFVRLNAVEASVKDVRELMDQAKQRRLLYGKRTILFLDEVHRFNSARQDVLLPAVEQGDLILIGATTENPLHHVNGALLSRSALFRFERLSAADVSRAVRLALADAERGLGGLGLELADEALTHLTNTAGGDVRRALGALETAARVTAPSEDGRIRISAATIAAALDQPLQRADKTAQFDVLSAFHKSVRGSSADAVLWFLYGVEKLGMDPLVFARRLVVACSEDIGLVDSQAFVLATNAYLAYQRIGWPEAKYNLVHAIRYAVEAPKSRAVADEIVAVMKRLEEQAEWPVPQHLRNNPL